MPEFGFLSALHRVTEGDEILVSVALGGTATSLVPATLSYAPGGDGDTAGSGDYAGASGTLTFEPDGASRQRLAVRAVDDGVNDIGEHFTLVLTGGAHAKVGAVGETKVEIADADPVKVGVEAPEAVREGETAVFTLGSDVPVDNDLKLKVRITQSGDYVTATVIREYTVVLKDGATSVDLSIATSDIDVHETDGWVQALVLPGDGYGIDAARVRAKVAIDGAEPTVGIGAAAAEVVEGVDAGFTVSADFAPARDLAVSLTVAQQGDYAKGGQTGTRQVTLVAGRTEATYAVETVDDAAEEGPGSISVTLEPGGGYKVDAGTARASVAVLDDETPEVLIEASTAKVTEGATASFTVRLPASFSSPVTVSYQVSGTGGYATAATGTVAVPTTGSAQIEVPTVVVAGDTPDGELTVTAATGTGYRVTGASSATVAVADNEPTIVTIRGSGSMIEGNLDKTAELTVSLSRALVEGEKVTVPLRLATRARDFLSGALGRRDVVVHAPGADIGALDSDTHELGSGVRLFGPDSSELAGQRTPPNAANYAVEFKGGAGTPQTATMKLTARAERSPNDKADARVTVSFRPSGWARLTNVGGGIKTHSGHGGALFTVVDRDRDVPSAMTLTVDADTGTDGVQGSVAEGGGVTMVRVTATIDGAARFDSAKMVTVKVGEEGDSATGVADYARIADRTITINAGQQSGHAQFALTPADDALDEPAETISFKGTLTGVAFADTGITITDDDPTTVTLAGAAGDLDEGSGKDLTVTLGRGLVAGESLEVPLSFSGTATRGTDYTLTGTAAHGVAYANLNSGGTATVTFTGALGGATATVAAITLTAAADSVVESTAETVDIGLGTPAASGLDGGTSETDSVAGFGIVDPDKVSVSTASLALTELHATDAERTYTLVLGTDPGADVEVTVASADTTAVLVDADANAAGDQGSLTFTHGGSGTWDDPQTVTVRAVNDADAMGETVTVSHDATVSTDSGNPYHGISIGDVSVTVTDAGHGVTVSESALSVYTNNDTAEYSIVLNSAPGGTVTVTPTSSDTAKAQVGSPVRFNDSNWRNPQTVTVTGRGVGSATISHAVTGATTAYPAAMDIDTVAVTVAAAANLVVSPANLTVGEGSSGSFTVRLATVPSGAVTVSVASDNSDVTAAPASLTFNAGGSNLWSAEQTVTVSAAQDDDGDNDTATLTLGASGGGYDGRTATVGVAVTDDDVDTTAPQVTSIARQSPTTSPTNADELTWRVTFSEPVVNVGAADFQVSGTTAALSASQVPGANAYDVEPRAATWRP